MKKQSLGEVKPEGFNDVLTNEERQAVLQLPPPTLRQVLFGPCEEPWWQIILGGLALGAIFYLFLLVT